MCNDVPLPTMVSHLFVYAEECAHERVTSHSFSHLLQDPLETTMEAQIRELSESVSTW